VLAGTFFLVLKDDFNAVWSIVNISRRELKLIFTVGVKKETCHST
jgi:hypothetical protein